MYFPYLYGKRAELGSIKKLAADLAQWGVVTPIVEPVKSPSRDLQLCLEALAEHAVPIYLIINPTLDDFQAAAARLAWSEAIRELIQAENVRPAFQINGEFGLPEARQFLEQFPGRDKGIVLRTGTTDARDLKLAIDGQSVTVFVHPTANPRHYARELPKANSVLVENSFNAQARNADYSGTEWFTDAHKEFAEDGRPGFSDFGPMPATYQPGGGRAAAVAVHLALVNASGSILIQHFVSDSRVLEDGNATSKMAEATAHVSNEVEAFPDKFIESQGLLAYLQQHRSGMTTNLESNKLQQLIHHITVSAIAIRSQTE